VELSPSRLPSHAGHPGIARRHHETAEPFVWTKSKVHQRHVKGAVSATCDAGTSGSISSSLCYRYSPGRRAIVAAHKIISALNAGTAILPLALMLRRCRCAAAPGQGSCHEFLDLVLASAGELAVGTRWDGYLCSAVGGYWVHGIDLAVISRSGRIGLRAARNARQRRTFCNGLAFMGRLSHDNWHFRPFLVCLLCRPNRGNSSIAGWMARWPVVSIVCNSGIVGLWPSGF